ncbi:transglycosylase SLT domain-containing protein [Streptomyces sp. NPDC091280]|uniref:transglycosylase SLT domain-containing protein n=1 Tax=Streptomyces sp. NPDC091280 TaxID=3365984 RepID=UPI0037F13213
MSTIPTGVKVGNAFIEINPQMDQDQLARQLASFEEKVKATYKRQSDVTKAYARLQVQLEEWVTKNYGDQAKARLAINADTIKARKKLSQTESALLLQALAEVEKAELASEKRKTAAKQTAARAKERIALNARDLEIKYGTEVADAYKTQLAGMQAGKKKLTLTQINETKRWAELEQAEIRKVAAAQREAQQAAIRGAQVEATEKTTAAKKAQVAYTRTFEQVKSQLLEQMQLERMRERARLEGELAIQTASAQTAALNLANARSSLAQVTSLTTRNTATMASRWKKVGGEIEKVGSTASELGRTLMTSVVTPMAAAGSALTVWGLKAADNFQNTQTSLKNMGMALQDANDLMNNLTTYGLQTPYAVGDMLTYGARFSRAIGAHNKNFTSSDPTKHAKGSEEVSTEAQNIVQMIGDLAARGGITDSSMVQRGYYAMEKLMDADRVSLRDTKQLEYAVNMPVQELAQLLGFTDSKYTAKQVKDFKKVNPGFHAKAGDIYPASAQMMEVMANAKTTGGVRGQDMVKNLLGYWEGKTNVPGAKPDKTIQGSAERLGTATFGSRISNMKETAQQNLRKMFQTFDPKTGELEYTGLGAAIMGKRVQVKGQDGKVHNEWQGGLLNKVAGIGSDLMGEHGNGAVPQLMSGFVEGTTRFIDWVKKIADELDKHPEVVKAIKEFGKLAAVVAPVALALGATGKIFGKIVKLFSPLVSVGGAVVKGLMGGGKIVGQVMAGLSSSANGTGFLNGYRGQRAAYNNGDERNLRQRAVDRIRGNNSQEETLRLNATQYEEAMRKAKDSIADLKRKINDLNRQNLDKVAKEAAGKDTSVQAAAQKAQKATDKAARAVRDLDKEKLRALRDQISSSTSKATGLNSSTDNASSAVKTLNGKSLKKLRDQFKDVTDAADKTIRKVSTLTGDIHTLSGKNLNGVTKEVKTLGKELEETAGKAEALNLTLDHIAKHKGDGGSSKTSKPKKHAKGGIIPGYAPGVDNVPAILSPGEAVLRPEVTHALGAERINSWNSMAARGKLSRKFAKGGIVGKLGLNQLIDAAKTFNIGPDALSAFATMTMDSSSRKLGGDVQSGVVGSGTAGSHFVGSDLAEKFKGMFDFTTKDSWKILKKLPIPDGWSQVIGILGGALTPITGEYFWDDVWKGQGNVLQRGTAYLDDLFSTKTLTGVVENLFGGIWDSVKSLFSGAKALLTDPVGTVEDSITGLWELSKAEYDGTIDMVKSLGSIFTSPMDYAGQVVSDLYSTAKDSLPNTEGLFDFSGDHLTAKKPDVSQLVDGQLSTPGTGSAVSRWTPQVKMVLAQLGLSSSNLPLVLHRIGVESGGNPKAINNWDSNAKAGDPSRGLMQTIGSTFRAYAGPYLKRGIYDPLASIYAGLNYAVHRYGSNWTQALAGTKGYATGTTGAARGWAWVGEAGPELVHFGGGETVLNNRDSMLATVKVLRGYATGTGTRTTGVAADAEKGVSSLNSAVKKLYEIITKAFTSGRIGSGSANSLNKWLDKENKQLQSLVKQRADIAPKLKDANAKLAAVKKDEADMASSISDKSKEERSLSSIFNTDGVSTASAISGLHERLAAIKTFQSNVSTLVKRGFSKDIISEIAQAGPEEGGAMAKELLNATSSQVSDLNKTYAAIGSASDSLGKSVAGSYYSAGKKAAQSLVDGLTAKDNKLKKQIEGLADEITKTLKKKLHFTSKTPVDSGLAALLTWLTGESQSVKGGGSTGKKKTTRVTTSYSTDSKGRQVTTVTTTVTDPAKGTTTTTTERTVGGKTTKTTKVSKVKGYWTGTLAASPGMALVGEKGPELVNFGGGERVYNARQTAEMMGNRYEIHIHEAKSENTTQAVLRAMQYAEVMAAM